MTWDTTGKPDRHPDDSDAAIQTCLTIKILFGTALGQMTGFVASLLRLIGRIWAAPDFSTLSRRQKPLKLNSTLSRIGLATTSAGLLLDQTQPEQETGISAITGFVQLGQ